MIHKIKMISSPEESRELYKFLKHYPLDYLDYLIWLDKCRREIELGYKKAIYCTNANNLIVGSIVFQPHKQDSSILELKNLRVDPLYEHKGAGSILEQLAKMYACDMGFKRVQGDAHADSPVIDFMLRRGYKIESEECLYTSKKEIIFIKEI